MNDPTTDRSRFISASAILAIEGLAYAIVLPLLPAVASQTVPWWAIGLLLAAYSVCQFAMLGPLTRAARRFGLSPVVALCLLGTSIGMLLTASSTQYWVLLAGRILDGLSAGTVVLVTAAYLRSVDKGRWTTALGRLSAARGGAILLGILVGAAIGLVLADPSDALRLTAGLATILPLLALVLIGRIDSGTVHTQEAEVPILGNTGRLLSRHISAQTAQTALLVLAPAIALVVATQVVSFLAPAAAIIGLGIGQVLIAPRVEQSRLWRTLAVACLVVGALAMLTVPLVGLALVGIVIGTAAPMIQARLLRSRIANGSDDLAANALAGRGAIIGQTIGPIAAYLALSVSQALAAATIGLLGANSIRRPPRA